MQSIQPHTSLKFILTLSSHLRRGMHTCMCAFLCFPVCYMPCPSQPIWLRHSSYIWRRVRVMKHPIMAYPPVSYYFMPLGVKFLLSAFFSYNLGLRFSLKVRHQVSYPHKTKGKIGVLHILILIFLDSRRDDRKFWTKWKEALPEINLVFILSWIKLWVVAVVPNILTLSRFQSIYYLYPYFMILL
jgi:hypothetical protein